MQYGKSPFQCIDPQFTIFRLCTEAPRAGGRVLEEGDQRFLALAHELQTPVVVVFTEHDMLVWSKQLEEEEDDPGMDEETLLETSKTNANNAFADCALSLGKSTAGLRIPMPPYINISDTNLLIRGLFGINAAQFSRYGS
ncbi:hypothetical protein OG21DRAFT_1482810 [Imleria badia]|nr:hypothetical protein OG21DRAFT_1482810 [Imleria badia]